MRFSSNGFTVLRWMAKPWSYIGLANKRVRYQLLAVLALAVPCLPVMLGAEAADRPPNVVMLLADDLGWRDLACYGNQLHETPRLDELASEGVLFTDAYAAAAICSPTRASILTGRSPARLHLTEFIPGRRYPHAKLLPPDWTKRLELEEQTLAEVLKDHGYATAMIGKWHLGGRDFRAELQGFDVNIAGTHLGYPPSFFSPYKNPNLRDGPEGEHLPLRLAREAGQFIEAHRDRPFFLYLSFFSVHLPIQPDPQKLAKYRAKLERHPAPVGEHDNPHYAAMVESLDEAVGVVLDQLDRLALARETIVVFFSDNGGLSTLEGPHTPATTNRPLRAGKGWLYEGGIRVPLIVRWLKTAPEGAVCDLPVISHDFFPTLIRAAGVDLEHATTSGPIDGIDISPWLKEPDAAHPDRALYWHYPHYPRQGSRPAGAIRDGRYKLIEHFESGRIELFDLRTDIGEERDLTNQRPDLAARLRRQLEQWRQSVDAQPPRPNPDYDPDAPFRDAYWRPQSP